MCLFSSGYQVSAGWDSLRLDPPYNPFATYLRAPGPVYHLSRLRLILLDSEAQLPRVHRTRPIHPPESSKTRSDKSERSPPLQGHCGIGSYPTPLNQLVAISCFGEPHLSTRDWGARDTPDSPALSLCGLFPVFVRPDVPTEPPRLGDREGPRVTGLPRFACRLEMARPHPLSLVTRGGSCPHYPRPLF